MSNSVKKIGISIFFLFIISFLLACNEKIIYIISFESNGGSLVSPIETEDISSINIPSDLEKDGFTFEGWYWDNDTFNKPFNLNTLQDQATSHQLTLYAKWIIIQFDISYVLNDGINHLDNPITYSIETLTFTLHEPERVGYTFEGWFNNNGLIGERISEIPTGSKGNITLFAKWQVGMYEITFDSNEGTALTSITQAYMTAVVEPISPQKLQYTFEGWYLDIDLTIPFVFDYMPAEDITLYANWIPDEFTIDYVIFDDGYDHDTAILLTFGETVKSFVSGSNHMAVLTSNGRLFVWGWNRFSQLGDGTIINQPNPLEITSRFDLDADDQITSVFLGYAHSSAITLKGRVFTWGFNHRGQLGDGTKSERSIPTDITGQFGLNEGETISSLSFGNEHSLALTSMGRVFSWGDNSYGQLGDGTTLQLSSPQEINGGYSLNIGESVMKIASGSYHSLLLTTDNRVFTWGNNSYGQIGDGTTLSKSSPIDITNRFSLSNGESIIDVSISEFSASIVTSLGRTYVWGYNHRGQLGDGTTINRLTPTETTDHFSLDLDETITSLSINGSGHSSALTSNGRVFTWGANWYGQLGNGTIGNRLTPTEITDNFNLRENEKIINVFVGMLHTSAITSSFRMFTWGRNEYGQLGNGLVTDIHIPQHLHFYTQHLVQSESYTFQEHIQEFIPSREGFEFSGWYIDAEMTVLFVFSTLPTENKVLFGYWIEN